MLTTQASQSDWMASRCLGPMAPGSVLIHCPSTSFQAPGGGENQAILTARYLEDIGVEVRPFVPWTDRLERSRLIHLFGMSREGLELARLARLRGVPLALSPICWVEPRAMAEASDSLQIAWQRARWATKELVPRWPCWRRELLDLADVILPNSEAEARQLARYFGADRRKVRVVPNGVEERFAGADPTAFRAVVGLSDFVLYVGRIEPRKNVLRLIQATRMAGLPLVVIGDPVPGHQAYAEACRRAGGGAVHWLPRIEHDDPTLASAFAAARVFALPSWFETPGLAALEAALAGAAVVLTPLGCTREYFGDRVSYARPDRVREIARQLRTAWDKGPDLTLSPLVRSRYLWPVVARRTGDAYDQIAA
jgi:glycosyltransferase involved in cell wall biosynthesis